MRANSSIQLLLTGMADSNVWGETMGADSDWSEPIPCHVRTISDSQQWRYEDGICHKATYNILTYPLADSSLSLAAVQRLRLSRNGRDLGEFTVQSIERIETQNRLQIVV